MGNKKHVSLFQDSFPNIIREYESYLGLNPTGLSNEEYANIDEDSLPIDKVNEGEFHLGKLFQDNTLTTEDVSQIQQALAYLSLRLSYTLLYSKSTATPILLPSKNNYYGVGRVKFQEVFNGMINLNNLTNRIAQDKFINFLTNISSNEIYKGNPLTLEIRIINIMIILLKVMNNTVSVSFLAQLLLQQDTIVTNL